MQSPLQRSYKISTPSLWNNSLAFSLRPAMVCFTGWLFRICHDIITVWQMYQAMATVLFYLIISSCLSQISNENRKENRLFVNNILSTGFYPPLLLLSCRISSPLSLFFCFVLKINIFLIEMWNINGFEFNLFYYDVFNFHTKSNLEVG